MVCVGGGGLLGLAVGVAVEDGRGAVVAVAGAKVGDGEAGGEGVARTVAVAKTDSVAEGVASTGRVAVACATVVAVGATQSRHKPSLATAGMRTRQLPVPF